MSQASRPFDYNHTGTGDDTEYTAAQWREIYRDTFGEGVISGLAVTGVASPVSVALGAAWIDGVYFSSTTAQTLAISTPIVGTTGGHIILRVDYSADTARLYAVSSTDGISTPPALTQTSETLYEIRIATYTITTGGVVALTDAREYMHFSTRVSESMLDTGAV